MFCRFIRHAAWLAVIALIVGGPGIASAERPNGSYPAIRVTDDPLFGGHFKIDWSNASDLVWAKGDIVVKGNGDIRGDLKTFFADSDPPECDTMKWKSVKGSVKEKGGVVRLEMKGTHRQRCRGIELSGPATIKGEIDSMGRFSGRFTSKVCHHGDCATPIRVGFSLQQLAHGAEGPWDLVIQDVVKAGTTHTGATRISGRCTLKPQGSATRDSLKFKLTGTYNKAKDTSTLKCTGAKAYSKGATVRLRQFITSGRAIVGGRIGGKAFGQRIGTHVP